MTETAQERKPVVQSIEIDAPAERVFELWTEPEELVKWWPDAVERLEPRVGGTVKLHFEGRGEVWGEFTRFDPPSGLGFTWIRSAAPEITTHVEISIDDLGDGRTRVELVHSGFENVPAEQAAEWIAIHDAGWKHFLGVLRDAAEGRPVDRQAG